MEQLDCSPNGGDESHDILRQSVFNDLITRAHKGAFRAIFAAPPCSTFSISRFLHSPNVKDGGPPPVRDRDHILGLPDLPPSHLRELTEANLIVDRTMELCTAAFHSGSEIALENPCDRGDISKSYSLNEKHGPIWCQNIMQPFPTSAHFAMPPSPHTLTTIPQH